MEPRWAEPLLREQSWRAPWWLPHLPPRPRDRRRLADRERHSARRLTRRLAPRLRRSGARTARQWRTVGDVAGRGQRAATRAVRRDRVSHEARVDTRWAGAALRVRRRRLERRDGRSRRRRKSRAAHG